MRFSPIKTSFNGGEWSPNMYGRVDLEQYASACELMRNVIPLPQGPASRRPGTRFVSEVYDSTKRAWLARFEFNYQQSFILEFSPGKLRFYTNHGLVLSGGVPYIIDTPFTEDILINPDGTFALSMVQSNDVIWIACGKLRPQKLSRISNTNWTIAEAVITSGPFMTINNKENITVFAAPDAGGTNIRLFASEPIFDSDMVGNLFYLEQTVYDTIKPWEATKSIASGAYRRNAGNNYQADTDGTTGFVGPVHTIGSKFDGGDPGVDWLYRDSGYIYCKIESITDPQLAVTNLLNDFVLPVGVVSASFKWAKSAWSAEKGYPTQVTFFRERLVFARDQEVWFSTSADYENFAAKEFGQIAADSAFNIQIQSAEAAQIQYLIPTQRGLIVGTTAGEILINDATTSEPFGPNNKKPSQTSGYGGRPVKPIRIDDSVIFVQRAGRKIREARYSFEVDNFQADDISLRADHIISSGIVDMDMAREPYNIIWMVAEDGKLVGLTYNKQQQVLGWHAHALADGDLFVEDLAVIPSPDGSIDDLWMVARTVVNGVTKRYVMYMEKPYYKNTPISSCFYVDCGATYNGPETTTITGLEYLEGKTVSVLVNGSGHKNVVVTAGTINLTYPGSIVQIGLPYQPFIKTLRMEGGSQDGTAQGKKKRINSIVVRMNNSLGVQVGFPQTAEQLTDPNFYNDLILRDASDPMDNPIPIFSGDKQIFANDDYNTTGQITITQTQPYPMEIVAIMPQVTTYDQG